MKTSVDILKSWFQTGDKPTENQFSNLIDSFHHKDDGQIIKSYQLFGNGNVSFVFSDGQIVNVEKFVLPSTMPPNFIDGLVESLNAKVSKVAGKQLSEENFTLALKQKLEELEQYIHPEFHDITEIKGLQNILSEKVDKIEGKGLTDENFTTEEKEKLSSLENYNAPTSKPISYIENLEDTLVVIKQGLENKVEKEEGKELSSNNFSDEEKEKLSNLNPIVAFGTFGNGIESITARDDADTLIIENAIIDEDNRVIKIENKDTAIKTVDEGNGKGYIVSNRDENNYGNVGKRSFDLTYSKSESTVTGVTGNNSFGFGENLQVSGDNAVGIGSNSVNSANNGIMLGNNNNVTLDGINPVAVGNYSTSLGSNSIAIGNYNKATSDTSIAIGRGVESRSGGVVAIGDNVNVTFSNTDAVAIGKNIKASGRSVAIGSKTSTESAFSSVAIGTEAVVSKSEAIAIGEKTVAKGRQSVSIGYGNTSESKNEISLGVFGTTYSPISATNFEPQDRLLNIGNGTGDSKRSDVLTILKSGEITAPSTKIEHIDKGGEASLITKEYADANYLNKPKVITKVLDLSYFNSDADQEQKAMILWENSIKNSLIIPTGITIVANANGFSDFASELLFGFSKFTKEANFNKFHSVNLGVLGTHYPNAPFVKSSNLLTTITNFEEYQGDFSHKIYAVGPPEKVVKGLQGKLYVRIEYFTLEGFIEPINIL